MCLRYTPTIVACVCIHLACKWSNYRIPLSAQGKEWFSYIDAEATHSLLDKLTEEFLAIFDKCPSKLKNKIRDITQASRYIPYFLVEIMLQHCLMYNSRALVNNRFDGFHKIHQIVRKNHYFLVDALKNLESLI